MQFTKMHGAGNDYIIIDGRSVKKGWPKVAKAMCARKFSVGADGLLVVLPASDPKTSDIRMKIFNPDGSQAEMCGNGIRCFIKFIIERWIVMIGGAAQRDYLKIETESGVKVVRPLYKNGKVVAASVNMGIPIYKPEDIPVNLDSNNSKTAKSLTDTVQDYPLNVGGEEILITCVSLGNPHAVAFVSKPVEEIDLGRIGPLVENHQIFPNRTNFEIVNYGKSGELTARVWERGVGETLSCGTGICAIAATARLKGSSAEQVNIIMPGGKFEVRFDEDDNLWMSGPAEETFTGEWEGNTVEIRKKNR